MKKGIIIEVHKDKAIIMNEKGQFDEINATSGMYVGREIEYGDSSAMKVVATLCMLFAMIGGIFGFNYHINQTTPVSYVAVDINPGVEFTLNVYDRIISASPTNEDGKLVLAGIDYKGEDIDTAVENFVSEATQLGYIDQGKDDNAVLITVVNDDEGKAYVLQDRLVAKVNDFFIEEEILGIVLTEESNRVLKNEADSHGLSAGKYRLAQQAVKEDENLTLEEASQKPVKELNKIINETTKSVESELIEEKQNVMDSVAKMRETREGEDTSIGAYAFGGVLAEYQNQIDEEKKQQIWDEVTSKEEKDCIDLETGKAIACPKDKDICLDEKGNKFVCPSDKEICVDDKGNKQVCPSDQKICVDEKGNKQICPENKDICIDEKGQNYVCPSDKEICVDDKGNKIVCPSDQKICFDEEKNQKFVCPLEKKICFNEEKKYYYVCPVQEEAKNLEPSNETETNENIQDATQDH